MDDDGIHRLSLRVRGRVQGVSFRAFTRKQARELGLRGWVRNEQDGTVSVLAEGPRDRLRELLRRCNAGPPFARVDQVEAIWDEARGDLPGFDIRADGR